MAAVSAVRGAVHYALDDEVIPPAVADGGNVAIGLADNVTEIIPSVVADGSNVVIGDGVEEIRESPLMGRVQEGVEWAWGGIRAILERIIEVVAPLLSDATDWVFDNQEYLKPLAIGVALGSLLTVAYAFFTAPPPKEES